MPANKKEYEMSEKSSQDINKNIDLWGGGYHVLTRAVWKLSFSSHLDMIYPNIRIEASEKILLFSFIRYSNYYSFKIAINFI